MRPRLAAAALILTSAAFQVPRGMTLAAGDSILSSLCFRDFYPAENGLRWSGARSAVVFPDPGPGAPVRVELLLSGWRPPGVDQPRVVLNANGRTITAQPGPGAERLSIETTTSGWWRSDLVVEVLSDTFEPGPGDARALGVRVEEARLIPLSRGVRRPPLGAPGGAVLLVLLVHFVLARAGASGRAAEGAAFAAAVAVGLSYALTRAWAAVLLGPSVLVLAGMAVATVMMPLTTRIVATTVRESAHAVVLGMSRLRDRQTLTLALLGLVLVTLAYRVDPKIDIDLGSGREVAVAKGFGSFVGRGGERARWALRGAHLDLSDFGGGAPWRIQARAGVDGPPRDVAVLGAAGEEIVTPLDSSWKDSGMAAPSPFGWRSGLDLTISGGSDVLRLARVTIDRGAALPSVRVTLAVLALGGLALIAFGAAGLSVAAGRGAAAFIMILWTTAIGFEPLAAIPFTFRFLAIVAAGTVLAAAGKGLVQAFDDGTRTLPGPAALGAAASGWVAWLTAAAFPFYRGGHFVFHSSIAEEIWKGRFLIYYLPYPGSSLSEQAQWGQIVMPHPALYQTLVSPLAALPRPWFYFSEKVLLATLLASMAIVASVVAEKLAGRRAGAFAAVFFAGLVPGFQLLGLGHLMTILGMWTSSMVLPWLMFKVDGLSRFKPWLLTASLFALCFLSYTAALLFTGAVLVWVILVSARENLPRARSVFTMLVLASTFAFLLYYVHWTLPFVMQSIPKIMGGAGLGGAAKEATPIFSRLALEPGKLTYSYGSMLIPLAAALSLLWLPRSWPRLVLLSWMGILFFVSSIDLFFNFLLKHHYYVMVPVAIGLGALSARIESRWGRASAMLLTAVVVSLGLKTAVEVALGLIP